MKTPIFTHEGIILDIIDYNTNYNYIRYCSWNYEGDINNSNTFYLRPKQYEPFTNDLLKSKKDKWYLPTIIHGKEVNRYYIPERFLNFINNSLNQ